ncbi:hypothetical protein, partial [Lishizhenia sp.]|uniref:hypothetical protein n=1 Tax=Lishizhenia sp. TaxID=2497594 RepID=UPI00299D6528
MNNSLLYIAITSVSLIILISCNKDEPSAQKSGSNITFGYPSAGNQSINSLSSPLLVNSSPNGG